MIWAGVFLQFSWTNWEMTVCRYVRLAGKDNANKKKERERKNHRGNGIYQQSTFIVLTMCINVCVRACVDRYTLLAVSILSNIKLKRATTKWDENERRPEQGTKRKNHLVVNGGCFLFVTLILVIVVCLTHSLEFAIFTGIYVPIPIDIT